MFMFQSSRYDATLVTESMEFFKDFFHMNAKLDLKPHYYEGIGHIQSV